MNITAIWRGMAGLRSALDHAPEDIDQGLDRVVRLGTDRTAEAVRDAAPRRTGQHVRPGVKSRVDGRGTATRGRVYLTGAAIPVAAGSRPHRLDPNRRRALRFSDGTFAAGVDHPGNRPNPFFARGVKAAAPAIDAELDRVGQGVLKKLAASSDR